jgi:hypothetical protein
MYNHNTVDCPELLFSVEYYGGSHGILRCGSWLHGKPKCVRDLFLLHMKICEAKKLVPWGTLRKFSKEDMLRIPWAQVPDEGSIV